MLTLLEWIGFTFIYLYFIIINCDVCLELMDYVIMIVLMNFKHLFHVKMSSDEYSANCVNFSMAFLMLTSMLVVDQQLVIRKIYFEMLHTVY